MSTAGKRQSEQETPGRRPSDYESATRIRAQPPRTLGDYASDRLEMLCEAAGFREEVGPVIETFRSLVAPWAFAPLPPGWVSDISDDNTPIELSVTIAERRSEVRVLFETQGSEATLKSYRAAGLAFHQRLEREFGADLRRFRIVQDLFMPEDMEGPFAVWNSVVFAKGKPPAFKTYFNPQARGRAKAYALVEEALQRLGLDRAWGSLCRTAARRGPHLDEVKYLALDLTSEPESRVKVYVRHHGATPDDLEIASSAAAGYVPGEALHFARAMGGDRDRLAERATFTCSAFIEGQDERPVATTLYVPVCAYAKDDAVVTRRVDEYLVQNGIDADLYGRIVHGFANRPLAAGVGMQSWVALRRYGGKARLTVYLATEATQVFQPGTIPAATGDRTAYASAEGVVRCTGSYDLAKHPFIGRMMREPNGDRLLWLLIQNLYEGTSKHLAAWQESAAAKIRAALGASLEELGVRDPAPNGQLMRDFVASIDRLRPTDFVDAHLDSGRKLAAQLGEHYASDDAYEILGALAVSEVCAEQLLRMSVELLRSLPRDAEPQVLDRLISAYAGEGLERAVALAARVPTRTEAIQAFRRGAAGVHGAFWNALDELYVTCFISMQGGS